MTLFPTLPHNFIILAIVDGSAALFLVELTLIFPARYANGHGTMLGGKMRTTAKRAAQLPK
jgi:hypothetical protein